MTNLTSCLAKRHLIEYFFLKKIRLDSKEIETVRTMVERIVGKGSKVRVFDSRLNDSKHGGDLDLLVESEAPVDSIRRADLKMDLEEKLALPWTSFFWKKAKSEVLFKSSPIPRVGCYDDAGPGRIRASASGRSFRGHDALCFFCDRLASGIPWPLTGNLLESRCKDFDLSDKLGDTQK